MKKDNGMEKEENMRRIMIVMFTALQVMLMMSCDKDVRPENPGTMDEEHTLTVRVVSDAPGTRAYDSEDVPVADGLHRLDLYVFHENEPLLDEHMVLEPDPTGVTTCSFREKKGERIGVLAIGNLHEDTAKLLEGKTLSQLSEDYEPEAMIVLSADNFATDRIVMVGAKDYTFSQDGTAEIELRRLMYRIDVGKITVAPGNEELLGKEIHVRNIAMTNVCNYFVPLKSDSIGHFYSWYLFFGNEYAMTNALGGIESGFRYYRNTPKEWDADGSFALDGPGILDGTFPYMINSNYQKEPGVLNVDATGVLKDATHQGYDNSAGEGLVVPAGDMEAFHSMDVGKCFYGFIGRGVYDEYGIVSEYGGQNIYPKLVIELSIDGESWFYPVPLIHPQPNTVYRIDNITVRDYGSEYSNFFPLKYAVDFSVEVADWSEVSVVNMNVGADPVTGGLVELYGQNAV